MAFKLWLESKFDYETTTISRAIINELKNNIDTIREQGRFSKTLNLGNEFPTVVLNFTKSNHIICSGTFRPSNKQITINITAPTNMSAWLGNFNNMIYLIKSTVRHELEHFGQDENIIKGTYALGAAAEEDIAELRKKPKSYKPSEDDIQNIVDYYTHPAEVAAEVSGLYKKAITSKQDFLKILHTKIRGIERSVFLDLSSMAIRNALETIAKTWIEYAHQRYPKALIY
jgi:hypothetical protein